MRFRIFLLLSPLFLFLFPQISSADNFIIDSLINELNVTSAVIKKMTLLNELSGQYTVLFNYNKAMNCAVEVLQLSESANDPEIQQACAEAYCNIGIIYQKQSNFPKALEYYLLALKIAEELQNKHELIKLFNNIGIVYKEQENYTKALYCYLKSLKISEESGDSSALAAIYSNIGNIYYEQGNRIGAEESYHKALKLNEEAGNKNGIAITLGNIGSIYKNLTNYAKALEYYSAALKLKEEIRDSIGIALWSGNIGILLMEMNDYKAAQEYLLRSVAVAENIHSLSDIKTGHKNLSELYERIGNASKSLSHFKQYASCKDSLFTIEKEKDITRKTMSYEFEKKEEAARLLREKETAIAAAELNRQKSLTYSAMGVLSLVMAFGLYIYKSYREKKKMNRELEKLSIVASKTDNYVMISNKNDEMEWVNEGFERITGYTLGEAKGKRPGDLLRGKKTSPEQEKQIEERTRSKKPFTTEILNYTRDKREIWLTVNVTPVLNKENEVVKYINIGSDITALKNAYIEIERQKNSMIDSVKYARRIQKSVFIGTDQIRKQWPESFVLLQPRDIVSGDFYWFSKIKHQFVFAAIDCMGHGIPGAFMSLIANILMDEIVNKRMITHPPDILNELHKAIVNVMRKEEGEPDFSSVEMDMALCTIDLNTRKIYFSGAKNPVYIVQNRQIKTIKGDMFSIGSMAGLKDGAARVFNAHEIMIEPGMMIYISSDGIIDQYGGLEKRKYGSTQFRQLLSEISILNASEQKKRIEEAILEWQGNCRQQDDILVMGMRVG